MVSKMKSKTVAVVALVIFAVTYVYFSFVLDRQFSRSLSSPKGTLQQKWEPSRIKQTPQEMSTATITCDRSHPGYDICSINSSCSLDLLTGTFTLKDPTSAPLVETIRPYPGKSNYKGIMPRIKELTLTSSTSALPRSCDVTHISPAIVFSTGGYTGSIYHDFCDVFIPLFITANSLYPDRDVILVVANPKDWWLLKYVDILREFSQHKPILLDSENVATTTTHCFTSATVGLISHGPMTIDPTQIPNSKPLVEFNNLLDKALNTNLPTTFKTHKPRLLLVTRGGNIGRVLLNENEIKEMLEDVGFEVIIFNPSKTTKLREAYKLIKSSHGMIGVHGGALTHMIFLRPGSVFVQVVPVGLRWAAETCFESPARAMKLEYIDYPLGVEESSLVDKYSRDDLVLKDPIAFRGSSWNATKMNIYLKEQDVRLDVIRFRKHMNEAYDKAKIFMDKNG